ncbi:MAG: hypothetical protein GYA17_07770, partial [Chloroflexi bacterium]|nr:hypothetical protein [Chloroflexota bacterium]
LMPPLAGVESPAATLPEPGAQPEAGNGTPAIPAGILAGDRQEEMILLAVVERPESYWVTWAYPDQYDPEIRANGRRYLEPFNPVLFDANGAPLPEPDHATRLELWQYEDGLRQQLSDPEAMQYAATLHTFVVPRSGVAFPVYARQTLYERSFPEKEAYAEIEFDGARVLASDEPLAIDREIQLGPAQFELDAIQKNPDGGYTFLFDGAGGKVVQCAVELVGYPSSLGGNSSFDPDDPFHFYQSILYTQVPTGELTLRVSQPAILGDLISFIGAWSPEK